MAQTGSALLTCGFWSNALMTSLTSIFSGKYISQKRVISGTRELTAGLSVRQGKFDSAEVTSNLSNKASNVGKLKLTLPKAFLKLPVSTSSSN